ncbi:MAG TPA: tRNA (guanosine(37)-N1)-methyltransferase TrmD [bacterium]|nr:tRNA (guanosine(37)-N1)-methyltransferase TrmD [bacterium]
MRATVLTIFPEFFRSPLETSFFRRAQGSGAWQVTVRDIRDHAREGVHRATDDTPAGGGPGMVMLLDPIVGALEATIGEFGPPRDGGRSIVLLSAAGPVLTQAKAEALARRDQLILICGHYEGVDERLLDLFPVEELSIGDYVLTGGESAALVVLDAVVRLLPDVLGNPESIREESFQRGVLDHPAYTKPAEYRGLQVPEVLLSGHHGNIARWRRQQALLKTARNRPDLLRTAPLSDQERVWLKDQGFDVDGDD